MYYCFVETVDIHKKYSLFFNKSQYHSSIMSSAYSISSPVDFTNTTAGDTLNFFADATAGQNSVVGFVTNATGDLIVRTAGNENSLDRIAVGTAGQVLTVTGTTTAGVYTVTTVADVADSLNSTYFTLNSPTTAHYFWFNTGAGVDPGTVFPIPNDLLINGVLKTGNQVVIATNDTAAAVATALSPVINALADFGTVLAAPLVTITNAAAGAATAPADGTGAATGFAIGTTTAGASPVPSWSAPAPGAATESFMATGNTPVALAIASGAAWVPVDNTVIAWSTAANPNHDAGTNFAAATGAFIVPATGIYTLSASVSFSGNNTGVPGTITGRRAVRQARVRNTTAANTILFDNCQAEASALNPTQVDLISAGARLTVGDVVRVEVRHDASSALALSDEADTGTATASIVFSAARIA